MSTLLSHVPSITESPVRFFLGTAIVLVIARLVNAYFTALDYPSNLPRLFEKPNATSFRWSTRLKYFLDAKSLHQEAYEKFIKHGKTVLMPGLGFRNEVLLPHSALKWVTSKTDSGLSIYEAFEEMDQILASFPEEKFISAPWHANFVRKDLLFHLEDMFVVLADETDVGVRMRFGTDEENWKDVMVNDTVQMLIAQVMSRFTVGVPLCRNDDYLHAASDYVGKFIVNAGVAGMFPKILRPFARTLLFILSRRRIARMQKHIEPLYHERFKLLSSPKGDDEPFDQIQLMLRYVNEHERSELNPHDITCRVAVANIASFHQTYLTTANIIFNIVGSDEQYDTIAQLREEFTRVLAAHDGQFTKAAVAQLWKADSVCKETLRMNGFAPRSMIRQVSAPEGVVTEDGIHLPRGALVSIPIYAAQTGEEMYGENPREFDPWRFLRAREAAENPTIGAQQSFVTTGPGFLPFGHGKHACPGRFLLDGELKIFLAELVLNYDMKFPEEYGGKRPENVWLSEAQTPPPNGRVLFKRRKGTV